jgi:hypothetical protein
MFSTQSDFFKTSQIVAEDFLQTALIVDDQAFLESSFSEKTNSQTNHPEPLLPPGRQSRAAIPTTNKNNAENNIASSTDTRLGSHVLDANKVIISFAQKRIVCSIIKPTREYNWQNVVEQLAANTDLIILDWEIDNDNGEKTLALLIRILKASNEAPEQLKLLAIYTGEPGIADVATVIKNEINQIINPFGGVKEYNDGFTLAYSSIRIAIFSKPGTTNLPQEYEGRKIEFEELANRVTTEFTMMTAGLVSNVALKSLAKIRHNTNKIINRFSSSLDAPFLTHRIMQINPEDAENLLVELIAEELRAILDEESVGQESNIDNIRQWLIATNNNGLTLQKNDSQTSFSVDEITKVLIEGYKTCAKFSLREKEKPHKLLLTAMFMPPWVTDQDLDERFSIITTLRTHYKNKCPKLTFGTILQNYADKSYWVCIQPRCDSVRIPPERAFPVLPIIIATTGEKFRLIINDENGSLIRVAIQDKPYNLNQIIFFSKPEDHGTITSKIIGDHFYFKNKKGRKYRWVGELRPEQAQRLANEFATNLSRVGLDESEWLRLWSTKGK